MVVIDWRKTASEGGSVCGMLSRAFGLVGNIGGILSCVAQLTLYMHCALCHGILVAIAWTTMERGVAVETRARQGSWYRRSASCNRRAYCSRSVVNCGCKSTVHVLINSTVIQRDLLFSWRTKIHRHSTREPCKPLEKASALEVPTSQKSTAYMMKWRTIGVF
jgi:hypothetical protein